MRDAPRRGFRAFTGLMLAAGLGTGLLELHGGGTIHAETPSQTRVAVDARHAAQAAHFESSRLEPRKGCAACLLRSQTRPPDRDRPLVEPAPAADPLAADEDRAATAGDPRRRPPSRAPPLV